MRPFTFGEITGALAGLRDQTSGPQSDPRLAFLNFCLIHLTLSHSQFLQDLWVAWELGSPIAAHATIDSFSDSDMHAASRRDGERYPVETVSLNDLLAFWDAPRRIDYLSIDTEGSELDILQHFDFDAYDVRLITVEHNHTDRRQPICDLLAAQGYQRKFETLSNVDDGYVKIDGA